MRDLLDMAARHADAAELYIVSSEAIPATFEMNKPKHVETRRMQGVALRVIKSGRVGFSSSTDTRESAAQGLINAAVDSADMGEPARFDLPGPVPEGKSAAPLIYDDRIAKLDADALIRMGQEIVDIITEFDASIKCSVQLERKVEEVAIANSNLGGGNYRKTTLTAMAGALLVEGNDILDVFDMNGSCRSDFDHRSIAREVLERVRLGRNIAEIRTGRMPVLFTHRGIMPLLMALQSALNGKTALDGASPLVGRIGHQVMDPRVCIYDDPTRDWAHGTHLRRPCPRRTPIPAASDEHGRRRSPYAEASFPCSASAMMPSK